MRYLDVAAALRSSLVAGGYGRGRRARQRGRSRAAVRRQPGDRPPGARGAARRGPRHQSPGSGLVRRRSIRCARRSVGSRRSRPRSRRRARRPERRILEFGFEPAPAPVAASLGLEAGAEVLRVRRLNLADGVPFALVTVWLPAALGARREPRRRASGHRSTSCSPLRGTTLGSCDADDRRRHRRRRRRPPVRRRARRRGARLPAGHLRARRVAGRGLRAPVSRAPTTFEIEFPFVEPSARPRPPARRRHLHWSESWLSPDRRPQHTRQPHRGRVRAATPNASRSRASGSAGR